MLDRPSSPLRAEMGAGLPVAKLVIGMPVEEVAELLPRVFNLCRAAQRLAVHRALGLPADDAGLSDEAARDHLLRLCVLLPDRLDLARMELRREVIVQSLPETVDNYEAWGKTTHGLAPLIARLTTLFARGEAVADLPLVCDETMGAPVAVENSVAARHADHPVMRHLEAHHGRGPVWRVMARAYDLAQPVAVPQAQGVGEAMVPAARGRYYVRAACEEGRVVSFARVTPTDHLMAAGGVMEQCLASLPEDKHHLAPLVVDILDPCSPVTLKGGRLNA